MNNFEIDERLKNDCHLLGRIANCHLLLMNNSLVPWFILVPETEQTEWYLLEDEVQASVTDAINWMSEYINTRYQPDKLNVAAIGNIVKQMHIHIVGRFETDYCWPGVVWGAEGKQAYSAGQVQVIKSELIDNLEDLFQPSE